MSPKTIFICVQAFFVQAVLSQCRAGPQLAPAGFGPVAYDKLATPFAYKNVPSYTGIGVYPDILSTMDFTPTSGGGLPVTSSSAVPITGLSVISENAYDGILFADGELPFVGTSAVEAVLPSAGAGAINHACGTGLNTLSAVSPVSSTASVATTEYITPHDVAYLAPGLTSPGFVAPALAATGLAAPGFRAPGIAAPGFKTLAEPALVAPGISTAAYTGAAYVTPSLPCDDDFLEAPLDIDFTATDGGDLPVKSGSSVPPTGLVVASETVYEGTLTAAGELPFVGTAEVEGVLPTAGAGAVHHSCGNGINAIVSDKKALAKGFVRPAYAPTFSSPATLAPGYGKRAGWTGRGCGCL